jgi:hypothetical protein
MFKKIAILTGSFALLIVAATLWAAQVIPTPLPYIFSAGTVIDPSQMNANFNWVVSNVNNNALNAKSPSTNVAWSTFTVTGTTGPVSLTNSYNIASTSYNASNHFYTATFTNALANANYIVTYGSQCLSIAPAFYFAQAVTQSQTASSFTFTYASMNDSGSGANVAVDCYPGNSPAGSFLVTGGY